MNEYTKGEIELFTLNGRLPKVREIKMAHGEASHFEALIKTKDNTRIFKLDFGYGKKEDKANAERLVKCWNCHDDLVAACKKYQRMIELLFELNPEVEIKLGSALGLKQAEKQGKATLAKVKKE